MFIIGIILIIIGVFTCAFGVLQNTILHALFADLNARLARHNTEDFIFSEIFVGPGLTEIIIGVLIIAGGIILVVINKKNKRKWLEGFDNLQDEPGHSPHNSEPDDLP